LRSKAVDGIGRAEIVKQLREIEDASGKRTADCAKAHLGMCFAWAMDRYALLANPVLGIKARGGTARRTRTLTNDEIRELWIASKASGPQGGDHFERIVKLLLLTAQRRDEIANLPWSELNNADARIELPPERTKNHLPHMVPLSDQAAEVLAGVERVEGDTFVFGRGEVAGFSGWSRAKAALDARIAKARKQAGVKERMPRWTIHDLRRTAASGMAGLKIEPAHIEAVLNHVSGVKAGVAGTYNQYAYLDEKREALKAWGAHVAKLVTATVEVK
jgi:integrase